VIEFPARLQRSEQKGPPLVKPSTPRRLHPFLLAVLILSASSAFAEPVASWDLSALSDGRIADTSGNGHDLSVSGGGLQTLTGRRMLQAGPNVRVTGPALGDGWSALTLTAVIYQPLGAPAYAGIIARDNYGGPTGDVFALLTDPNGNWSGRVKTGEAQSGLLAPATPGWHHLALTWDGAVTRLFVDGQLADEAPLRGDLASEPETPLALGAYSNGNGWFQGGIAAAAIYDGALPAEEVAAQWTAWQAEHPLSREFSFSQASDVHITDTKSVEILNDAVDAINADDRVAFSLWLGDLTQNCTSDEMALARMGLGRLQRPRHTLRGNHDQQGGLYEREFGELNYTFEHAGWKFIMLDTNPGDKVPLDEARMQWLREVIAQADPQQPLVLCTHHPLAPAVTLRLAGADEILALFAGHNLKAVLGAHHHGNHEEIVDGVLFTKTACLATTRSNHDGTTARGYRLFHCTEDAITTEFVPVP
jgi:calcineurin-like phosphoesterase family protein